MFIPQWQLSDSQKEINPEIQLFDNLACEFTMIAGFEIDFYLRKDGNLDQIYGEDALESLDGPYRTKLVYQPTPEMNTFSMFGMSSDETIEYAMIPKSLFKLQVTSERDPIPGDVVRTLWNNKLFELVDVGSEAKIFQGHKMIWEFIMRPWRQNNMEENGFIPGNLDALTEFPDINLTVPLTEELAAFGDNSKINQKGSELHAYSDVDEQIYGYRKV